MPRPFLFFFSVVVIGFFCGHAHAQTDSIESDTKSDESANSWVELNKTRFDTNKDGKVGKWELPKRLRRNFGQVDKDSDGFLNDNELKQFGKLFKRDNRPANQPTKQDSPVPDSLARTTDIAYRDGDSAKWKLDLVHPKQAGDESRPAIVFIHGGGWQSGDKGVGAWRNMPIAYAEKGYVCISVNYRLTDEAPFPACIEDCQCAVRWLRAHAEEYNVDPDRIGAFGMSAGAHLVAMLGVTNDDGKTENDNRPHAGYSSTVASVCCVATPTHFLKWTDESANSKLVAAMPRLFGNGTVEEQMHVAKMASPISHLAKDPVPFLVIHGTADKTVPVFQGDTFVEALKKAGGDVTYLRYEGSGHGVYGQNKEETQPKAEAFFARTLGRD